MYLLPDLVSFNNKISKCCSCTSPEVDNAAMQKMHGVVVEFEGDPPNVSALFLYSSHSPCPSQIFCQLMHHPSGEK
jgi:hypothetical protein